MDDSAHGIFITQARGTIRLLEEVYLWGGVEYVTVNGQTALYCKMRRDAPATFAAG